MDYMKNVEIVESFEREINKLDDGVNKPNTEDSLFWLNQAVTKFMKLRFNGDFVHKTSYEENEKRREDLINLFKEVDLTASSPVTNEDYVEYSYTYPTDLMFILNEDVIISDTNNENKKHVSVFECTQDSFMYRIMNGLTDFHYKYKYARPLRIRNASGCKLLTDGKYLIKKYTIGYLRFPTEIKLGTNYNDDYTWFSKQTMYEIVKIAAQMYIENVSDPRYRTISAEVNTQE